MRHLKKFKKLDRARSQRKALLKNLASSVILHEKINTTKAKAKALVPYIERIINKAKNKNLVSRRFIERFLTREAAKKLYSDLIGSFLDRPSGFVRIVKLGRRKHDAAEIARVELILEKKEGK